MLKKEYRNQKNKWIVAHLGARMHYALPEILYADKRLFLFFTDIYFSLGRMYRYLSFLPNWFNWKKLVGRNSEFLSSRVVKSFLGFGLNYFWRLKGCESQDCQYDVYLWAGKKFNQKIISKLSQSEEKFQVIYSFNSASLELFRKYKNRKLLILEQCIAPFLIEQEILKSERIKHPNWEILKDNQSSFLQFTQRELEELELSDVIVCPSAFVKESISRINHSWENKTKIVPYGVRTANRIFNKIPSNGPLRILTVGKVGLRKGTPYILEAARYLKSKAEFRIVGDYNSIQSAALNELEKYVHLTGQVNRHEVSKYYEWADVFLLPSLCEGSATVTYEAMQYGIPLIVTHNTGSLVRDGLDGYIIPAGSSDEIIQKLLFVSRNKDLLTSFSTNIKEQSKIGSFDSYMERINNLILTLDS